MKQALRLIGSMKIAVVLLILAMVLVYAGSWAQIDRGIYQVQKQYFHAWFSWIELGVMLPRADDGGFAVGGGVWFPGGYLLGAALLVNLLAAQLSRVAFTWRRAGIHVVHVGVLLLLVGEAWSSVATVESRMRIHEGASATYSEDIHRLEIALIDRSPQGHDAVAAVAVSRFGQGEIFADPRLPVGIRVDRWYANSELSGPMSGGPPAMASAGAGLGVAVIERRSPSGAQGEVAMPSAYVTLLAGDGQELGRWLLSVLDPLAAPQEVSLPDGSKRYIQLRSARYVKPYRIELLEFRREVYAGTQRPKSFSSRVRIIDPERGVDREELIWMNHPLRYRGEVFYQASFDGDDTTILQVVRNPAAVIPYIACAIGSLGLLIQFSVSLGAFLRQRAERGSVAGEASLAGGAPLAGGAKSSRRLSGYALALSLAVVAGGWIVVRGAAARHGEPAASLPIYHEGRLQPLDSVARNSLRILNGREAVRAEKGARLSPAQWLMDVLARPEVSDNYPVLLIENPDLASALQLDTGKKRFAFAQLQERRETLQSLMEQALEVAPPKRDLLQRQALDLGAKYNLYASLRAWMSLLLVPPADGSDNWTTLADAAGEAIAKKQHELPPIAEGVMQIIRSHREQDLGRLEAAMGSHEGMLGLLPVSRHLKRIEFEVQYNRFDPFMVSMALYVLAMLLVLGSWLIYPRPMLRAAFVAMSLALLVHTAGLAARIYIQGRPPVTNLYSSAVFIGWFAIVLAIGVELLYRNGVASLCASLCGFGTLIVAQHLSLSGDTMGALQAVLDSNFWLTTHVLAITCGYSAAFLAGLLGAVWLLAGLSPRFFAGAEESAAQRLDRAVYGIICFAMLFSFVGTVLGGIWADQSWGRFWGWDPKENGAVLIVLWLAAMLHARAGRLIGARGFAVMAVGGNIVTAWSWFGTNMLGVGLHSYGFMDEALGWLLAFVGVNLLLMLVAFFVSKAGRCDE